jgi:hypothetical protein
MISSLTQVGDVIAAARAAAGTANGLTRVSQARSREC